MTDSQESNESNESRSQDGERESPPSPQSPPGARIPRGRLIGLAIIVLFLFLSSYISLRGNQPKQDDDTTRLSIETLLKARTLYARLHTPASASSSDSPSVSQEKTSLLNDLQRLVDLQRRVDWHPTPHYLRTLAIVQLTFGDPGWKQSLLQLQAPSQPGVTLDMERELALWKASFEPESGVSGPQETERLADGIRSKNLGWYEHLALEQMYGRRGEAGAARRESQAALLSTGRFYSLTAFGGGVVLVGVVLWFSVLAYYRGRQHDITSFGASDIPPFIATPLARLDRPQSDALYLVFVAYLFSYAAIRLGMMNSAAWMQPLSPLGLRLFTLALSLLMMAAPLAVFLTTGRRSGLEWRHIGFRTDNLAIDLLWGVGGYAMALPLLLATNMVSSFLFRGIRSPAHPVLTELAGAHGLFYQMILFSQVSLLPALIEETMFRGVFFRSLSVRMGAARGMMLSAAIFSILHPQLPLGFLSIFALGLVFNLMFYKRGSLLPCIIAHALNNGIIFLYFTLLVSG